MTKSDDACEQTKLRSVEFCYREIELILFIVQRRSEEKLYDPQVNGIKSDFPNGIRDASHYPVVTGV